MPGKLYIFYSNLVEHRDYFIGPFLVVGQNKKSQEINDYLHRNKRLILEVLHVLIIYVDRYYV